MTKREMEPFWWGLFAAGGTISAFVTPALLFLNGLVIPLGWVDAPNHERILTLVQHPLSRLFVLAFVSLSLLHWAHRFRFTLYDGLQLKHLNELIAVLTYGIAIIGTLVSVYILW